MKDFKNKKNMEKEKIEVYYVASKTGYAVTLESVKFSSKENADKFIALMKSEGYEITKFGNEGYNGE